MGIRIANRTEIHGAEKSREAVGADRLPGVVGCQQVERDQRRDESSAFPSPHQAQKGHGHSHGSGHEMQNLPVFLPIGREMLAKMPVAVGWVRL